MTVQRTLFPVALLLVLAGCGNKGPLVLPSPPEPADPAPAAVPPDALAPTPPAAVVDDGGDDVLRVDDADAPTDVDADGDDTTSPPPPPGK